MPENQVRVHTHYLPPTTLIPNSPYPLLHYPALLPNPHPSHIHTLFTTNAWKTHWIYRYGATQKSHYHSSAHECMAVLTGTATIRFGAGDTNPTCTDDDLAASTHGPDHEAGGVEIQARAGDVFVVPAGVSHKTFDAKPQAEFALLTPGTGHGIEVAEGEGVEVGKVLEGVKLEGFTMIGSYPVGGEWDFCDGGEGEEKRRRAWGLPKPGSDPVLGMAGEGLCGLW
ncbi:hypothetical protein B0A50_06413 [Salinomyces thailandicus]|uniref:Cupin type-1 domain-containing protein n=1 Tax=Salinomyces thailandicus TaxID=706561 RepID=A0A4U0TR66_9PEZI|nr:hypothetical protein B0A50_06413 [Salinomyces thailandica]